MKPSTILVTFGLALLFPLFNGCDNIEALGGKGSCEENVAAYCRAIQGGDYAATMSLTMLGVEALRRAEQGPAFERTDRVAEAQKNHNIDIVRYYKQIFPPSAQWKVLEVGNSQVQGVAVVYTEISYPSHDEADFSIEHDRQTLKPIRHHIKKAVYSSPVEQKSKLLVDLPNFRPIMLYKTLEMWD